MAEQPPAAQRHKGRAVRYRVSSVVPHDETQTRHRDVTYTNRVFVLSRAALCQVFDSIFLDIPMGRVKFNVNTEYAYIQNFKVLQSEWEETRRNIYSNNGHEQH